ncbi:Gag protein [Phytophthora cinnamomi]|uniref:Gag protein n=1 Tax=Phytophthora cinnamomi TaxID=4785 RepID=UPI00355992A6|nr:Gag protein [Phytophthora cinnamomi]
MDGSESPHLNDSQFESVRKMAGIFGTDTLRSLAAATPAEQVERISTFDTYEQGLIAHVQGLQASTAEPKPVQPKPLMLKVHPFEGRAATKFVPKARKTVTQGLEVRRVSPTLNPSMEVANLPEH